MSLYRTPLWQKHKELGAKMVEFSGWSMPVSYSSILDEHRTVRKSAGIFDVSHMGQIEVKGSGATKFINHLTTCDAGYAKAGDVLYTLLLNEEGGVIDDLLLYCVSSTRYFLCVNAGNTAKGFRWISKQVENFEDVIAEDISRSYGMLAIQGPNAEKFLQSQVKTPLSKLSYYSFLTAMIGDMNVIISRTGYTGEDGFEIYCKWRETAALWDLFMTKSRSYGIKPIGLAARDTLRLEMRYPLHGSDIDEKISPMEAGLGWAIDFDKEGGFIGKEALLKQKVEGIKRRLVGIKLTERGIPRTGYKVFSGDDEVGEFTSGAISPTLNVGVGLAYIQKEYAKPDTTLTVDIRGKKVEAIVIKGSFVESRVKKSDDTKADSSSMENAEEVADIAPVDGEISAEVSPPEASEEESPEAFDAPVKNNENEKETEKGSIDETLNKAPITSAEPLENEAS